MKTIISLGSVFMWQALATNGSIPSPLTALELLPDVSQYLQVLGV